MRNWLSEIKKRPLGHWSSADCEYAIARVEELECEVKRLRIENYNLRDARKQIHAAVQPKKVEQESEPIERAECEDRKKEFEKKRNVGGHYYPGCKDGANFYTSDCEYGCGCWMGGTHSGGPDAVDPFGPCPHNPKIEEDRDQ